MTTDEPRRRRKTDNWWWPPDHWYRDAWLFAITVLVLIALNANQNTTISIRHNQDLIRRNQQANTITLCAFRNDLEKRHESGLAFLHAHPNGFAGITASTLNLTLTGQASTLASLQSLMCPKTGAAP